MSDIKLFEGNPLANSDLFKSLQKMNDTLGGNSFGTTRRISLRGGKFREIINGEQVKVSKDDTMNIVVIAAAPIARTFYEGTYNPDVVTRPTCWSSDTEKPDEDVLEDHRQANRCADCPQNIKGSGQGESRACRFSQRLAVVIEGDMKTVYQLQLPATSIFGDAKDNKMPMQGYARFLKAHNTPAIAVVTQMRFDEDADVPKLFFSPVRPLSEDELEQAVALMEHEDTKRAIEFKVFETDHVPELPEPVSKVVEIKDAPAKKTKAKDTPKKEEEDDIPEPEKKVSKKAEVEEDMEDEEDLAALVSSWDD